MNTGGVTLNVRFFILKNMDIHRLSGQGPLHQGCPAIFEPAEAVTAIDQLINTDGLDIHLSKTDQ